MALQLGPKDATGASTATWTNEVRALHDGAPGSATIETGAADNTLDLTGFDFSALPAALTITGITVRIDAYKDETNGSGTLTVSAKLSWNNGSNWTTAKKTANLTTTEQQLAVGSAVLDWGHTWTRAELLAGTFKLRLTNTYTSIIDTPKWLLDYASVTVFYNDETPLVCGAGDTVRLRESSSTQYKLGTGDHLAVHDNAKAPNTEQRGFSGSVIDELQAAVTDFNTATAPHNARVGVAAAIVLNAGGGTYNLNIADHALADAMAYSPALVAVGDISVAGSFGNGGTLGECAMVLPPTALATRSGSANGPVKTLAELSYGGAVLGSVVYVYAVAYDTAAFVRLLFHGVIDTVEFYEDRVELTAIAAAREVIQIPSLQIDNNLLDWNDDHGKLVAASDGAVVPLCYGEFSPRILYNWFNECALLTDKHPFDYGTQPGIYAALMGVKFPMAPAVAAVDGWHRKVPGVLLADGSTISQRLYLVNDTGGGVGAGFTIPSLNAPGQIPSGAFAELYQYQGMVTWHEDLKRGSVFVRDRTSDVSEELQAWGSGGQLAAGGATAAAKPINSAVVFYANLTTPAYVTDVNYYGGILQSLWVAPRGKPLLQYTTGSDEGSLDYGMTHAERAYSFDPLLWAKGNSATWEMSVEYPVEVPSRGEIFSVRGVVLHSVPDPTVQGIAGKLEFTINKWNGWNTAALTRHKPDIQTTFLAGWSTGNPAGSYSDISMRTTNGMTTPAHWVNFWPRNLWPKPGWRFSTMGRPYNQGGAAATVEWPWWMRARDLPYVDTRYPAELFGLYMDIIYRPTIVDKPKPDRLVLLPRRYSPYANQSTYPLTYVKPANDAELYPQKPANAADRIHLIGTGPADTGTGTYTGTALKRIENPADIAGHMIQKYLSEFSITARGSTFGSFVTARTMLSTRVPQMSVVIDTRMSLADALSRLAEQSMCMVLRQPGDYTPEWRMLVDTDDPIGEDPARMYRADLLKIKARDILQGSLRVSMTPLGELAQDFVLQYGLHEPTGQLAYQQTVNARGSTMRSMGGTYKAACAASVAAYGMDRQVSISAPWVWNHDAAEQLLAWHVDNRRRRRVFVECELRASFLDLKVGHVLRFDDSLTPTCNWPGDLGSNGWQPQLFNITDVAVIAEPGTPLRVKILAAEVYTSA